MQLFRVSKNIGTTILQSSLYRMVAAFLLDPRCSPKKLSQEWQKTISNTVLEDILEQSTSTSVETSMNPPLNRSGNPEGHFCIFDARQQPELKASTSIVRTFTNSKTHMRAIEWWQLHGASHPSLAKLARRFLTLQGSAKPTKEFLMDESMGRSTSWLKDDFFFRHRVLLSHWQKDNLPMRGQK